jgi:hypothetical protein
MRRFGWVGAAVVVGCLSWGAAVSAQSATTVVELPVPLLPQSVQGIHIAEDGLQKDVPPGTEPAMSEDGLQRSARGQYGATRVWVQQFNDASGAYSAFTFHLKPGARVLKPTDPGVQQAAIVGDSTVYLAQTVVLVVDQGADPKILSAIVSALPKVGGPKSQPPLLPTFFPAKGLVQGSIRYALGPASFSAMGGTLDAAKLGWEKSAEAAIAEYADKRGKETVTLLLYPTPQIAGDHLRAIEAQTSGARTRREGELVIVAAGTFSADDAQNFVENIHLHNELSFDKPMPLEFHTELRKTYSLLSSIAILSGAGMLAAVILGLFLGGGRAMVRKLQGKDAATDAEFLSLHLDNQNPRPKFDPPGP